MGTVVSCPECQRKLKIAPTAVGKSVKCPCGNVFKAQEADEPAPVVAPHVPAPTTLVVACDGCQTKLKVPVSARGRKMKCSKCGTTFVVPAEDAPVAPPSRKPTPPPFEDAASEPEPPAKKPAGSRPAFFEDDDGNIAMAEPRGKARPAGRAAAQTEAAAGKQPKPASGCAGCVLSVFVFLIVLAYAGAFVPLYFELLPDYIYIPIEKPNLAPRNSPKRMPVLDAGDKDAANDAKKNGDGEKE
jgi:hypothetical protein